MHAPTMRPIKPHTCAKPISKVEEMLSLAQHIVYTGVPHYSAVMSCRAMRCCNHSHEQRHPNCRLQVIPKFGEIANRLPYFSLLYW
jgi:hypothetical protein